MIAATTTTPAPSTMTAFCRQLIMRDITTTESYTGTAVPATTTAFGKNAAYARKNCEGNAEIVEVPQLDASWSPHTSASQSAFSPAHTTTTLADITYETMQRQLERTQAVELCDGDKTYKRAPSTLDQPGPPKNMGQWQISHGNSGAYRQVHVQESLPEYMRSPSANSLPTPHWTPEPIHDASNGKPKLNFVPELMYTPSSSSFAAPNWGDEMDWFSDFPAPMSPISSGSSASSIGLSDVPIASPRPLRLLGAYAAEIAHLEVEAAAIVEKQEARARELQKWIDQRQKRERLQEEIRSKEASRRMRALAAAGRKVFAGNGESRTVAWAERQEESAWYFGPARRSGAWRK